MQKRSLYLHFMHVEMPVSFEYEGKAYQGILSQVSGAGKNGSHYHLNIDGVHRGQFFLAEYNEKRGTPVDLTKPRHYKWRSYSQKGANDTLAAQFEKAVEAWHQSNVNTG